MHDAGANPLAGNALRTRDDVPGRHATATSPWWPTSARAGRGSSWVGRAAAPTRRPTSSRGSPAPCGGWPPCTPGAGTSSTGTGSGPGWWPGTDPAHPEYWGPIVEHDQRFVEAAAIGVALLMAPDQVWDPLDDAQRQALAGWLTAVDRGPIRPNNWLFFRVLVDLGLARVGIGHDPVTHDEALDRIDALYQGSGWYRDGPDGRYDWYGAFADTYGLVYAASGLGDAARAGRFVQRAGASPTTCPTGTGPTAPPWPSGAR